MHPPSTRGTRGFFSLAPSSSALNARANPEVSEGHSFALLALFLLAVHGLFLLAYWPGILGEDSYAILLEVESNRVEQSNKPIFWYLFVKLFYEPWRLVEIPIGVQMVIASILQARILSWLWKHSMHRSFFFCLLFITLAPHLIFFVGSLYSDGIYAVAMAVLMFEVWLVVSMRRVTPQALIMVFLAIPFAVFSRPNGIVNLLPILAALLLLSWRGRIGLGLVTAFWCALAGYGASQHDFKRPIGTLFPVAAYETVNFMQPHPMYAAIGITDDQVSKAAAQILLAHGSKEKLLKYYDRDYWDPLVFFGGGPDLLNIKKQDRAVIVREFFLHNVWANFPAFLASRVNIFMVSALAKGLFPHPNYTKSVIERTHVQSEYRKFDALGVSRAVMTVQVLQYQWRWLLWTPFVGLALTFWVAALAWRQRNLVALAIGGTFVLQFGAIFMLSIAGEYRYLLCFFTAPLVLLPMLNTMRQPRKTPAQP